MRNSGNGIPRLGALAHPNAPFTKGGQEDFLHRKRFTGVLHNMEYTVFLRWDEDYEGYCVEVTALPGCVSQGTSKEEAMANIREAIELHLECMKEDGEELPVEESSKVMVKV